MVSTINHRFTANGGITPKAVVSTTIKALRRQAKNIGHKGYSRLRKQDLVARTSEIRGQENGGLTPKPVVLTTIKALLQQDKNIGLKRYSHLQKGELVEFIASA